MPDRIWIQFADNGNIRKWQREPFEEGTEFVSTITPAEVGGLVDVTQPLDDLHVSSDGACDWSDIANAIDEVRRLHATALEAQATELAARPDWPTVNATYEKWKVRAEIAESALTTERAAHAETKRVRDDATGSLSMISEHIRPLIPEGQEPSQADNVFGIIGFMILERRRAEAAEAQRDEALKALEWAIDAFQDEREAFLGRELRNGDLPPEWHRARRALTGGKNG